MTKKTLARKPKPALTKPAKAKTPVRANAESRALALACAKLIEEKRGADIVILDVSKLLQITDYFIICTGQNKKQNQAIADNLSNNSKLSAYGHKPEFSSIQGYEEGLWVLVDLGRVVAHIFVEPLRRHYDLEFLWAAAPKIRR
jgi:ribosome-associated protein